MKSVISSLILLFGISYNAEAKMRIPIPWGETQKIHKIQSIEIPSIKDSYFGYVTEKTHVLYIFGLYIETVSYAVGSGKEEDKQGDLIDEDILKALKFRGIIPKTTPSEPSLSFLDILEGFSFWWVCIGLYFVFRKKSTAENQ